MTPELVVIGHVTRDLIHGEERLGGAACFAALAAVTLGVETGVISAAPSDFALLAGWKQAPLALIPSPHPTTFELDYSGPVRQLHLRARAVDLLPEHVPADFVGAPLAYVAPVIGECGPAVVRALAARYTVLGLQGWLRQVDGQQKVVPLENIPAPIAGLDAVVFSEQDHPQAEFIARRFAEIVGVVALTRGARGVTLLAHGERLEVPAQPANEIDPTGAGDVFGVTLGLGLSRGLSLQEAAHRACGYAARVVEGPGLGRLSPTP